MDHNGILDGWMGYLMDKPSIHPAYSRDLQGGFSSKSSLILSGHDHHLSSNFQENNIEKLCLILLTCNISIFRSMGIRQWGRYGQIALFPSLESLRDPAGIFCDSNANG